MKWTTSLSLSCLLAFYPYLGQAQENSVSATIPPETLEKMALTAIERGLYQQASGFFQALPSKTDLTTYGQAIVNIQKSQYLDAYKNLQQITSFDTQLVTDLTNDIALQAALQARYDGHFEQQQQWLSRIDHSSLSVRQQQRYRTLTATPPYTQESLRIGLLAPLSGPFSDIGKDMVKAAKLALFETNNTQLYLYPHDTHASSTEAARNAMRDGAQAIIGPIIGTATRDVLMETRKRRLPVISFSSTRQLAGQNIFLLSYLPEEQAKKVATYAADIGLETVAMLLPQTTYGELMFTAFRNACDAVGLDCTQHAFYDPTEQDFNKALKILAQEERAQEELDAEKILLEQQYALLGQAMNDISLTRYREIQTAEPDPIVEFDGLFVPATANTMTLLAPQLAYYDMDSSQVTLLGSGKWQNPDIFKNRAEYLRGGLFPASGTPEDFYQAFTETYGQQPHPLAVLAYDAVKLLHEAQYYAGSDPDEIQAFLKREEGFSLTSGPIRFAANGLPERHYHMKRLRSRSSVAVEPAATLMPLPLPTPLDPRTKRHEPPKRSIFWDWSW